MLFRAVLPVVLLLAVLFRYNIFSFVYLLLLLVNPLVPGPTCRNSNAVRSNCYLKTIVGASTLFCVAQVVYQIVLLSTQSYSRDHSPEESCSLRERLLALAGLHRADGIKAAEALRLLGLDFVVLFVGTFSLVVCEKLATPEDTPRSSSGGGAGVRRRRHTILLLMAEGLVLVLMAASGILYASLSSLAYFVCFLCSATTLGMHRPLGTFYRVMRTLLLVYSAGHLMTLYIYQLDFLQEFVPPSSLQARLVGLPSLRIPACNSTMAPTVDVRVLQFRSSHWTLYVSPLVLLCFYFTVATVTRLQLLQQGSRESPQIVTGPGGTVLRLDSKRSSQRSAVSSFSRKHRKESGVTWATVFQLLVISLLLLQIYTFHSCVVPNCQLLAAFLFLFFPLTWLCYCQYLLTSMLIGLNFSTSELDRWVSLSISSFYGPKVLLGKFYLPAYFNSLLQLAFLQRGRITHA